MGVVNKLASSLGRRDEVPNQELAALIVKKNDAAGVEDLIRLITDGSKAHQADAIKALYEIGYLKPELIAPHMKSFIALLGSKDNRMQWGAMIAIDTVTELEPKIVYKALPTILECARTGTVITRDHAVDILRKLGRVRTYREKISPLLIDEVQRAPINQFPTYAERAAEVVSADQKPVLVQAINARLSEVCSNNALKRLGKVLKKLDLA